MKLYAKLNTINMLMCDNYKKLNTILTQKLGDFAIVYCIEEGEAFILQPNNVWVSLSFDVFKMFESHATRLEKEVEIW